jgi:hypothetical protein
MEEKHRIPLDDPDHLCRWCGKCLVVCVRIKRGLDQNGSPPKRSSDDGMLYKIQHYKICITLKIYEFNWFLGGFKILSNELVRIIKSAQYYVRRIRKGIKQIKAHNKVLLKLFFITNLHLNGVL